VAPRVSLSLSPTRTPLSFFLPLGPIARRPSSRERRSKGGLAPSACLLLQPAARSASLLVMAAGAPPPPLPRQRGVDPELGGAPSLVPRRGAPLLQRKGHGGGPGAREEKGRAGRSMGRRISPCCRGARSGRWSVGGMGLGGRAGGATA
jgi:hypothetical protein